MGTAVERTYFFPRQKFAVYEFVFQPLRCNSSTFRLPAELHTPLDLKVPRIPVTMGPARSTSHCSPLLASHLQRLVLGVSGS
jgi:hypothetical protein